MSYQTFLTALSGIEVEGVASRDFRPPANLNREQLPFMYPRIPRLDQTVIGFQGAVGLNRYIIELVVVVAPFWSKYAIANYDAMIACLDNLNAALATNVMGLGLEEWSIQGEVDVIGETLYYILVARIVGSEA